MVGGDGGHGPIKSSRIGSNSTEGPNRPYFPAFPAYAAAGTGASTGGVSINGLTLGNVTDVAFNPSVAGQMAGILSATAGDRIVGSVDSGKTWFDIHGRGGASLAWWNAGGSNSQWLMAGAGDGTNLLSASNIAAGSPFGSATALSAVTGTKPTDLGLTSATDAFVSAIEPIPGTSMAVVAAARGSSAFYSEGSVSVITMLSGPSAAVSTVRAGDPFSQFAPIGMAYCGVGSAASIADKTFVVSVGISFRGSSYGLDIMTNTSQSTRRLQSTGYGASVVRVDCATGTVWTGNVARFSGFGGGLSKSIDGGATFSDVKIPTTANDAIGAIAIDPRAATHVIVAGAFENDVVETKDGGYTWAVLNDVSTSGCSVATTVPCGRRFGGAINTLEFPPKIAIASSQTAALRASAQVTNDLSVAGTAAGMHTLTTRTTQRGYLTFAGVVSGGSVTITGAQGVNLSFAVPGVTWTATSDQPFVVVTPSSGTGGGTFLVSINNTSGAAVQPGTYNATITVRTTGALLSTQLIPIAFVVRPSSAAPFGVVDTPTDGTSGVQGSIAVSGWALDDIEIDRVELWRAVAPSETTPPVTMPNPADPRNGKIFISNATFVEGARPDVEAQYGSLPRAYRAGWGYLMLTWGLWNQGNGSFTLYAFGVDKEGNITNLGTRMIGVNNSAANKPFGAIDTPGIGATVSGTIPNFGWGLTPRVNGAATCKIPSNGVQVSIDSGPLQPVVYGGNRTDIAGAFAGFSNSSAAGGYYILDTTQYGNGPHTIGWLITDDCNRADGVGSRFFNIQNGNQVAGSRASLAPSLQVQAADNGVDSADVVTVAHGYDNLPAIVGPDATGLRLIHVAQGDRIELRLPRGYGEAHQRVNGIHRALPVGATWDAANGIFYWQPAAAFLGSYEIVFVREGAQIRVRVLIGYKSGRLN